MYQLNDDVKNVGSIDNEIKLKDDAKNIQSVDPLTIGVIGTAVLGAISSIVNTHKTNKANAELWREQTAHNEEYNDPSAQRERLLNAGLSPLLGAYSSPILANGANPTQQVNDVGSQLTNLGTNLPNAIKASKESDLLAEQKRGLEIENDNKQNKIDAELRSMYKKMQLDDAQIGAIEVSNSKMRTEIDALNRTQDREDFIAKSNKEFQDWQKENGSEKTRIDWYNAKVDEALKDANIGLAIEQQEALRAKVVETMQHVTLMAQQGENIEADTLQKDMNNFIRDLTLGDEASEAINNAENAKKLSRTRNNAFVRAVEWTTKTFGSLLGGVGAAAVVASNR